MNKIESYIERYENGFITKIECFILVYDALCNEANKTDLPIHLFTESMNECMTLNVEIMKQKFIKQQD